MWPFAFTVGVIGYNFEHLVRGDKQTPSKTKSIGEERDLRIVEEMKDKDMTQVESLKARTFVPKTIFERNRSA
jgi:hypothetical protein